MEHLSPVSRTRVLYHRGQGQKCPGSVLQFVVVRHLGDRSCSGPESLEDPYRWQEKSSPPNRIRYDY